MLDVASAQRVGPVNEAVNFVALFEEQFAEIGSVLAGDAGDECGAHEMSTGI